MAASAETNEEVLARHQASFMEKIAELQERQRKGSKFLNIGEQIQRLVALEERQAKPAFGELNLIKRRAVLNIESHGQVLQELVKVGTNLRYVPLEEMFETLCMTSSSTSMHMTPELSSKALLTLA